MGAEKAGRHVVILGDTCNSQNMMQLCMNADVIVHETTLENELEENARDKGHSTPGMIRDITAGFVIVNLV